MYMDTPPGFEGVFKSKQVCRLQKSLYGLKQYPRAWFDRLMKSIKGRRYSQSQADYTMFFRISDYGKRTILIIYVDDIILTGDDLNELSVLKGYLAEEIEIKDLGFMKYFSLIWK